MTSCNQSFFGRIKNKKKRNLEVTEFLLLYYASQLELQLLLPQMRFSACIV
jgi:hypothetical protein